MKLAAIDIGSNAIRLLISEVSGEGKRTEIKGISMTRVPLRLGEDVFSKGRIGKEKGKELVKSIGAFKKLMEVHHVESYRAYATSAMREASNGEELTRTILEKTGIGIERIDGRTESELIASTYLKKISNSGNEYLYIDVGGGSTEVSHIMEGQLLQNRSFPIGTVRTLNGTVKKGEHKKMEEWCREIRKRTDIDTALGTGGNIKKLCKLLKKKKEKPIERDELQKMGDELKKLNYEDRMEQFGLKPDRADVIVPASDIYLSVMEQAGIGRIIVPKAGLVDGITTRLYEELGGTIKS